ncbi:MAG TPA: Ig-like domain-containing protein [Cytophagaceae bacterium]|jgi:hypothetical protein
MKKIFLHISLIWICAQGFSQNINPEIFKGRGKKLIEMGWDIPTAAYVKDNIASMEKTPFDGLCFRYNDDAPLAFEKRLWTEAEMNFNVLGQIQWGDKLTNNFLQLWGQSKFNDPDWYDDELWKIVVSNMKMFSKAMKLSRSKGVFFDSEFYFHNETHSPWQYNSTIFPNKDFNTVKLKVRQRGKEFISAIQSEMPNIDFMFTYLIGMAWAQSGQSVDNLSTTNYALLPAFFDGMLEGATQGAVFIEGNEGSYSYDETRKFTSGYEYIRNENTGSINLIAGEIRSKFNSQGQIAMALYVDQLYGRDGTGWSENYYSNWFVHNVYNGLLTSDQYVWCYSESIDWWLNKDLPSGISDSMSAAKTRLLEGRSLGFDMVKLDNYWEIAQAAFVDNPRVEITSPMNNASSNRDFTITVETSQPVAKVEFYINSRKIGEDNSKPYTYNVTNLRTGEYTLFAMAHTSDKNHISSNPVNIDVALTTANLEGGNSLQQEFVIFPNPAKSEIFLEGKMEEKTLYKIISIDGRLIETGVVRDYPISIVNLRQGMYIIKLTNDASETVLRFEKE